MAKLPNVDFPNFYTNLNNLFDRAFNWNRGSTAPNNDVVAGEIWVDSGNQNRLKIRNDANNNWIDTKLKVDQEYWGLDPNTAQFNASQLQSKPISTTTPSGGQVLYYNGTQWIPRTAGKVLQVVYGFTASQVSNTSGTFVDIGLSATITPQFANSKILVTYHVNGIAKFGANTSVNLELRRNNGYITNNNSCFTGSAVDLAIGSASNTILDAPNSTNALTYKLMIGNNSGAGTVYAQYFGSSSSTITLMEISA
jgi:hypothetical protein